MLKLIIDFFGSKPTLKEALSINLKEIPSNHKRKVSSTLDTFQTTVKYSSLFSHVGYNCFYYANYIISEDFFSEEKIPVEHVIILPSATFMSRQTLNDYLDKLFRFYDGCEGRILPSSRGFYVIFSAHEKHEHFSLHENRKAAAKVLLYLSNFNFSSKKRDALAKVLLDEFLSLQQVD
jgi:hypothetical protein